MRRVAFVISLMLLSGCGSCAEDKKVPEVEQPSTSVKTVTHKNEAGGKRTIQVGEGVDFANILKKDGGPDGG